MKEQPFDKNTPFCWNSLEIYSALDLTTQESISIALWKSLSCVFDPVCNCNPLKIVPLALGIFYPKKCLVLDVENLFNFLLVARKRTHF